MNLRLTLQFAAAYFVLTLCGMISCDAQHEGVGRAPSTVSGVKDPNGAISAFAAANSLHPFLVEKCGRCHGQSQQPLFAQLDPAAAYSQAIPLINSTNSGQSALVDRLINQLHNCWSGCPADGAAMKAAIDDFLSRINIDETTTTNDPTFALRVKADAATTIPTGMPKEPPPPLDPQDPPSIGTFATMTFRFTKLGPNAAVTVEIQESRSGDYILRNPRVTGLAAATRLENLVFYLNNGKPGANYAIVKVTLSPPGGLLVGTSSGSPVAKEKGMGLDTLIPGFMVVRSPP